MTSCGSIHTFLPALSNRSLNMFDTSFAVMPTRRTLPMSIRRPVWTREASPTCHPPMTRLTTGFAPPPNRRPWPKGRS